MTSLQAILRWDRDEGTDRQTRPTLNKYRKNMMFWALRELQRCAHMSDWNTKKTEFADRIRHIMDGGTSLQSDVMAYFEANWFTKEWLSE